MSYSVKIKYTAFGSTRLVDVVEWHNCDPGFHETTLWVERGEDYYALLSPQLRDKKVAVISRENWIKAPIIES